MASVDENELELYLNFYRYSTLILDHGSDALRFTIDDVCNRLNCTFKDFLNLKVHQLFHLRQPKQCCKCLSESVSTHLSIISKSQWDELYQSSGNFCRASSRTRPCVCAYFAKQTLTIQDLDITLASCILKNVAPISTDQLRDVESLRQYRNEFYAHATKSKMSSTDFSQNFAAARQVIESLISKCRPQTFLAQTQSEIDRLQNKRMDEATVKRVCDMIRDSNEHHLKLREEIATLRSLIIAKDKKGSLRQMKSFVRSIRPLFAQNTEMLQIMGEFMEKARISYDCLEERLDRIERIVCHMPKTKDHEALKKEIHPTEKSNRDLSTFETQTLDIRKTFREGDVDTLINLIKHRSNNVFEPDHRGRTLLHYVAEGGNIAAFNLVLSYNLDIETVDRRGHTVLHVACLRGHYDLANYLLLHFPSLIPRGDNRGWNAAHYAVAGGHLKILRLLREKKLLDKSKDSLDLLIYIACQKQLQDILDYLMREFPKKVEDHRNRVYRAEMNFYFQVNSTSYANYV